MAPQVNSSKDDRRSPPVTDAGGPMWKRTVIWLMLAVGFAGGGVGAALDRTITASGGSMDGLQIASLERMVLLEGRQVVVVTTGSLEHPADSKSPGDGTSFFFACPVSELAHIAHASVKVLDSHHHQHPVFNLQPVDVPNWEYLPMSAPDTLHRVAALPAAVRRKLALFEVPVGVPKGSKLNFVLEQVFQRVLAPVPDQSVTPTLSQIVEFEFSSRILSPYPVARQITRFKTRKTTIRDSVGLTVRADGTGYTSEIFDTPAFQLPVNDVQLSFRYNSHLGYFPRVLREFEVSWWGGVLGKESFQFRNAAAPMRRGFQRTELQQAMNLVYGRIRQNPNYRPNLPACYFIDHVLPHGAHTVQYYDKIGNISTSSVRLTSPFVELELEPRTTILGGWSSDWVLSYILPTPVTTTYQDEVYTLQLPFVPGAKDIPTQLMEMRVALPSGAYDISVTVPRPIKSKVLIRPYWGWLQVFRPRAQVVLFAENVAVVPEFLLSHLLQIRYKMSSHGLMASKIFCCSAAFFLCYAVYIIYSRIVTQLPIMENLDSEAVPVLIGQIASVVKNSTEEFIDELGNARSAKDVSRMRLRWMTVLQPLLRQLAQVISLAQETALVPQDVVDACIKISRKLEDQVEAFDKGIVVKCCNRILRIHLTAPLAMERLFDDNIKFKQA